MTPCTNSSFSAALHLMWLNNAEFFASELFFDSFNSSFPHPTTISLANRDVPKEDWFQCIALYKWGNGLIETVGFCNWIKFGEAYLEGGLCVKSNFYKRLPRDHWRECHAHGGIAQLMMKFGAERLNDLPAWFGYCGDKRSLIVTRRVGYQSTDHPYLIVKWFQNLPKHEQSRLISDIALIGPF